MGKESDFQLISNSTEFLEVIFFNQPTLQLRMWLRKWGITFQTLRISFQLPNECVIAFKMCDTMTLLEWCTFLTSVHPNWNLCVTDIVAYENTKHPGWKVLLELWHPLLQFYGMFISLDCNISELVKTNQFDILGRSKWVTRSCSFDTPNE